MSALCETSEGEQNQFDKETQKFPFRKAIKRLVCLILMAWNIKNAYSLNTVPKAIGLANNISSGCFSERIDEINFHT